jgi:hypothetical protein
MGCAGIYWKEKMSRLAWWAILVVPILIASFVIGLHPDKIQILKYRYLMATRVKYRYLSPKYRSVAELREIGRVLCLSIDT